MRVLGIDPAAAGATGFGVVETNGRSFKTVDFGTLPPARARSHDGAVRLREIHAQIARLVEQFTPDAVAVEGIFAALNVRTALKLAEVRGVVLLAAAQQNIPVHSYSPREIKSCVAGYGHASKQQMQQMVRAQLGMTELPQPADAADALAVALCHIHSAQARERIAAATRPVDAPSRPGTRRGSRAPARRIQAG